MRKAILILCILAAATVADAMGNRSYNAHRFGSDDHQRKHHDTTAPVPVPEPLTVYLLGAGLVGLAWARRDRG